MAFNISSVLDKNIILAANQAQAMVENKNIVVIPTKTVPQGITAVINYVPDLSAEYMYLDHVLVRYDYNRIPNGFQIIFKIS